MIKTLCLLILASLLPSQPRDQTAAVRGLKILPVSDLLFRSTAPRPPRLGRLTRAPEENNQRLLAGGGFISLESDTLLDLLRLSVGDAAENMSMIVRDGSVLVAGEDKELDKVEQMVNSLRRALAYRFSTSARLYRIEPGANYPAKATANQTADLTKGLPLLWSARTTTRTGQQVVLSQEKYSRYVNDVDVEVSKESSIGDPKISTQFEGIRLIVEGHTLIGTTDRVFKCQFALGEKEGEIEVQSTGVQNLPSIGIPYLRASSGSFSGRVPHDGALMVALQSRAGAGSNLLLVLQAGTTSGPTTNETSAGETLVLPISALTSPSLHGRFPLRESGEEDSEDPDAQSGYPELAENEDSDDRGDQLLGLLQSSMGELLEQDGTSVDLTQNGFGNGFVLIRGSDQVRVEARRILATLQDKWLDTVEVRVRTGLVPVPRTDSTFSRIDAAPQTADELLHCITLPCLIGHSAMLHKGMESAVVSDYDVEIAEKAAVANPIVKTTFSGLTVGVRPTFQGREVGSDLRVFLTYIPEPRRHPTAQAKGGDLYHVEIHKARFRHSGAVKLGSPMPLGWGPHIPGERHSLRMHQTVRFRKL